MNKTVKIKIKIYNLTHNMAILNQIWTRNLGICISNSAHPGACVRTHTRVRTTDLNILCLRFSNSNTYVNHLKILLK